MYFSLPFIYFFRPLSGSLSSIAPEAVTATYYLQFCHSEEDGHPANARVVGIYSLNRLITAVLRAELPVDSSSFLLGMTNLKWSL